MENVYHHDRRVATALPAPLQPHRVAALEVESSDETVPVTAATSQAAAAVAAAVGQQHFHSIAHALSSVPGPVFVVFGNRGFRHILASFLCNMALFPGMHLHLLLLLTDDDTASFLRTFGGNVTMYVKHQRMLEQYDYNTTGYHQLMLARGAMLVELLGEAEKQVR